MAQGSTAKSSALAQSHFHGSGARYPPLLRYCASVPIVNLASAHPSFAQPSMPGGVPEDPPGLEPRGPKRSRSAGAAPSTRTSPTSPSATSTPTAFGPPDAAGVRR
eukprot:8656346-Alexandrium_andersonii.AAC.1